MLSTYSCIGCAVLFFLVDVILMRNLVLIAATQVKTTSAEILYPLLVVGFLEL